MTIRCRVFGCKFEILVNDGGALRVRCIHCGCQSEGWRIR